MVINDLIEKTIEYQKEILTNPIDKWSVHSVKYCILGLEELLNTINLSYECEDGNLHKKDW